MSFFAVFSQSNSLTLNDSLIGFDEPSLINTAPYRGITAEEMPFYIAFHKRDFINQKYNIKPTPVLNDVDISKIATSYCLNEDFENSSPSTPFTVPSNNTITTTNGINGSVSGLAATASGSAASCLLSTCCPSVPIAIQVIAPGPTGLIDPRIGSAYPIFSVFGNTPNNGNTVNPFNCNGDFFVKINNEIAGGSVHRVSKTINVVASNSLFKFAYIGVMEMAHCCCDNSGVSIRFKDCLNNLLPVPQFSVTPPQGTACPGGTMACVSAGNPISITTGISSTWYYSKWTISAVDLSPYIGNCVTIEVIAYDCPYTAHAGYAYFDAQCDTMHVINNNTSKISANTSSVTISGCASITNTLSAPTGFDPYLWQGPAGFTTSTLQTISTNIPGTYTLTMGGFASFAPTIKYITLNHGPIPITTSSSHSILCVGDSAQLTASGVGSYTWSTGATTPSIYVKPSVNTTYTVDVNYQGCPGTAMITQSVGICIGLNNVFRTNNIVSVFPNPNKGEFNLKLNIEVKNAEIELRNVLGQIVFRQSVKQGTNPIKTENLAKGIYNYSILQNKEVVSVGKIMIE